MNIRNLLNVFLSRFMRCPEGFRHRWLYTGMIYRKCKKCSKSQRMVDFDGIHEYWDEV